MKKMKLLICVFACLGMNALNYLFIRFQIGDDIYDIPVGQVFEEPWGHHGDSRCLPGLNGRFVNQYGLLLPDHPERQLPLVFAHHIA